MIQRILGGYMMTTMTSLIRRTGINKARIAAYLAKMAHWQLV